MTIKRTDQDQVTEQAFRVATIEQTAMLIKMLKIGWKITKVVGYRDTGKYAMALALKGTAGWLLPEGKFERAAVGNKVAKLDTQRLR